jgi:AraC family transcriptional activator of pobA
MEAKRLLLYTDAPIKSIGYELGYEDYAQFSKFFKKTTGINPQEFWINNARF